MYEEFWYFLKIFVIYSLPTLLVYLVGAIFALINYSKNKSYYKSIIISLLGFAFLRVVGFIIQNSIIRYSTSPYVSFDTLFLAWSAFSGVANIALWILLLVNIFKQGNKK